MRYWLMNWTKQVPRQHANPCEVKNPLPWLDEMLNAVEHANFFENRATEYSKASTAGTWEDAFGDSPAEAGASQVLSVSG